MAGSDACLGGHALERPRPPARGVRTWFEGLAAGRSPVRSPAGIASVLRVILEHALLPVRPGAEDGFLEAFDGARQIIASMTGFRRLTLSRCIERPTTFLLLVEWETLEDHTEGFRRSAEYQEWRHLLHHFYDPFPTVEHFKQVLEV